MSMVSVAAFNDRMDRVQKSKQYTDMYIERMNEYVPQQTRQINKYTAAFTVSATAAAAATTIIAVIQNRNAMI